MPDWKSAQDVTTISFSGTPAGLFSGCHTTPRRQFVIVLSGQMEIGLGDGSKHVFGLGDACLVEDITIHGRTTATHGDHPRVTCTISLANQ